MRLAKTWKLGCALVVGGLLLAGGIVVLTQWTFVSRLATYPFGREVTDVAWYEPTETVHGARSRELTTAGPAELGLDSAALARAAALADALGSSAFVVARRGVIACERYWRGCGVDVPTNSFSMAKTLLSLLCGTAIARGEVPSLDARIDTWIHEWRGEARGGITVRDLLGMQSGLLYDNDRDNPWSDIVQLHLAADVVPVVLGQRVDRPAGRDFEYNNLNTQLLGIALERATRMRYADLLSERIWRPIGAHDAAVWLDRPGGQARVYGCLFATARDWVRVGELVRLRGRVGAARLVPADWFATIETPSRFRADYGLHVWLGAGDPSAGLPPYVYLDGKSKQRVFVIRELELVVVRTGEDARDWSNDELLRLVVAAVRD